MAEQAETANVEQNTTEPGVSSGRRVKEATARRTTPRGIVFTVFAVAVGISAAFVVLLTAAMAVLCRRALPYWDQWDNLIAGRTVTWGWLISQHNEHRILFPRLIYICDAWFLHERNDLELVANFTLQFLTAVILTVLGLQLIRPGWRGCIVVASLTIALMFSAIQWENIASPFQVQFFLVCFSAAACFALYSRERLYWLMSFVVLLLQILAVFSLASGLLVPVVTIILACWLRRPRVEVLTQVVAAAVLLGLYLHGYRTPPDSTDPTFALHSLLSRATYLLNELGMFPEALFGRYHLWIHVVWGSLGLSLLAGLVATNRSRPDPIARAETPLIAVALFVSGMCVLTAFGRARFGIDQATSGRYVTPVLLFWTALLLLCVSRVRKSHRTLGLGALGLSTMGIAILEPRLTTPAVRFARSLDAAIPAVMVPNGDRELLARLYPKPEFVTSHLSALQTARASIFAEPWSQWLDKSFPGGHPSSDLPICRGGLNGVVAVTDGTLSGWRLTGHLRDRVWPMPRLVFLDGAAHVVGFGVGGLDARAIDGTKTPMSAAPDRWLGEIENTDPQAVHAYLLDDADHALCSLT